MKDSETDKNNLKDRMIMTLKDEALNRVAGGYGERNAPICPLCQREAVNNICENLQCRNYGSYVISFGK